MMTVLPTPFIREHDYQAFRDAMGADLPDTFNEWSDLVAKHKLELRQRNEIVREIEVYPDEFILFCRSRGQSCNRKSLQDFAAEKLARQ
jgi:hypothetical protein